MTTRCYICGTSEELNKSISGIMVCDWCAKIFKIEYVILIKHNQKHYAIDEPTEVPADWD